MKKFRNSIISIFLLTVISFMLTGTSSYAQDIKSYNTVIKNNVEEAVIGQSPNNAGIQYDFEKIVWSKYKIPAKPYGNRQSIIENTTSDSVRYQDDFYGAINDEWIKQADKYLSSDFPEISYYSYLKLKSTDDLKKIFKDLLHNSNKYNSNTTEGKMINLYCNFLNFNERNKRGIEDAKKYTNKINNVNSIDDLTKLLSSEEMDIFNNLFRFKITPMADKKMNQLYIQPTLLGLVDAEEYFKDDKKSIRNREEYKKYIKNLLTLYGYSDEKADEKVDELMQFEKSLAESMIGLSSVQNDQIDYTSLNISVDINGLNQIAPNIKFPQLLNALGINKSNGRIIIQQKKWLETLNKMYTNENLPLIKNYIEITILEALSKYLNEDFDKVTNDYIQYIQSSNTDTTRTEEAYSTVYDNFTDEFGKLYAEKYCSEDEKKDIELLSKELISKYREKLLKCKWISDSTRANAIKKLDNMKINIGYPQTYTDYSDIKIKSFAEGGNLVENMMNISIYQKHKEFQSLYEPINNTVFSDTVTPSSVVAEYHFDTNSLVVTAGMMQSDFYNINDSKEKKLATIGYVLGHEISHAFDDVGALYDYNGNYNNWWSPEDYKIFNEKAENFKEYYSSIEYLPEKYINGEATLGENIADVTSLSCILDILSDMPNADYKEFFEDYAEGFKCARESDYEEMMLLWDTHSPYKCRVNNVLSQFEKFYQTYNIKSGDGMYVEPEKRLSIW